MRRTVAFIALVTLAACGGSDSTSPPSRTQSASFTGTYVLQTVNGKALPYTWKYSISDSLTVRSFSLSIGSAGSWTAAMSTASTSSGTPVDQPNGTQSGTYTYDASTGAVSLISQDQSIVFSGSVSTDRSTLTVSESTDIYVFKK